MKILKLLLIGAVGTFLVIARNGSAQEANESAAPAAQAETQTEAPKKKVSAKVEKARAERRSQRAKRAASKESKKAIPRSRLTRDEAEAAADRRDVLLAVGEDYTIDLEFEPSWETIQVGNPTVLGTQTIKARRQITLKPLKDGETTVQVRDADGNLKLVLNASVERSNLVRRAREIRDLLRDVEGINVRVVGSRVVIEGEVLVPGDYAVLLNIVRDKSFQEYVINNAKLSQVGLAVLAKKIEEECRKLPELAKVTTRVVNSQVVIEGNIMAEPDKEKIKQIADLYSPPVLPGVPQGLGAESGVRVAEGMPFYRIMVVVGGLPTDEGPVVQAPPPDPNAPPPGTVVPKQIRLTMHFVELTKDYGKIFAFKWQPGFTADPQITVGSNSGGQAQGTGTSFTGTISSLFPKLRTATAAGFARVLKTATLVAAEGVPSSLSQETQIPVQVSSQQQGAAGSPPVTQPIKVSFLVSVSPMKVTTGTNSLQVPLLVKSAAVVGKTADGKPITTENSVTTTLYMNSGDSAAIAALSTSDVGTDFNRDDPRPGGFGGGGAADPSTGAPMASVPTEPLFTLLSSKNYRKKKSQIVVFVTPQIINDPAADTQDLKRNFRIRAK
ncbi:MAG: hypothetical protein JNL01_04915 [Bdellovibrionales bacterium]|nr:hypothetical protein [Bdellovibrionales bacterium]